MPSPNTLKFALKKSTGLSYRVAPLEGLWWTDDMQAFTVAHKGDWKWTMMIAQPEAVTPALVEEAREEVRRKKSLPAMEQVLLEPTIVTLHRFIHEQGYTFDGRRQKHHEIYLSDLTRTAPERMKTIVRQPIAPQ